MHALAHAHFRRCALTTRERAIRAQEYAVQNLVTTYDTRFRVDVEQFAAAHAARVADVRAPSL